MEQQKKQTDTPFFSIIVPVYNAGTYLEECIESIIAQSCSDFELILIDDGSTDGSAAICDNYETKYPGFVTVVHKVNQGPLLARCDGFVLSRGSYLLTVDSDDLLIPNALEFIYEAIAQTEADVVTYGFTRNYQEFLNAMSSAAMLEYRVLEKKEALLLLCEGSTQNSMSLKAVKRECACLEVDWGSYSGMVRAEDMLQTTFIYDVASVFCTILDSLYYYRDNPSSTMNGGLGAAFLHYEDSLRAAMVLESYAKKWEGEYNLSGLLDALSKDRLLLVANQALCLANYDKERELENLRVSRDFLDYYSEPSARRNLRFDHKVELWLLSHRWWWALKMDGRIKAKLHG